MLHKGIGIMLGDEKPGKEGGGGRQPSSPSSPNE